MLYFCSNAVYLSNNVLYSFELCVDVWLSFIGNDEWTGVSVVGGGVCFGFSGSSSFKKSSVLIMRLT